MFAVYLYRTFCTADYLSKMYCHSQFVVKQCVTDDICQMGHISLVMTKAMNYWLNVLEGQTAQQRVCIIAAVKKKKT